MKKKRRANSFRSWLRQKQAEAERALRERIGNKQLEAVKVREDKEPIG